MNRQDAKAAKKNNNELVEWDGIGGILALGAALIGVRLEMPAIMMQLVDQSVYPERSRTIVLDLLGGLGVLAVRL